MSLVKDYCITHNSKGNYLLEFNTTAVANVSYSIERGGTHVIHVNLGNREPLTHFTHDFGKGSNFKFVFDQPDDNSEKSLRKREPSGSISG